MRLYLLKRERVLGQARLGLTLMHVKGALGVDVVTPGEGGSKIEKLPLNHMEPSRPRIRCSTGSNEQWLIQTWMMNMTPNTSIWLAPGRAPTCVPDSVPKGCSQSSRLRTSPLSEQRLKRNTRHKCKPKLIGCWPKGAYQTLFGKFSQRHSLPSRPTSP